MKEQRIAIEIDAEGKVSADAEGFTGGLCLKDLNRLLEGVAGPVDRVDRKPDTAGAVTLVARKVGVEKKP